MTLMLIPGFMLDSDLWRDMEPGLAAAAPLIEADLSQGATIPAMAARLLARAPERFAVLGFSMGGYVARELVRQAPGRVQALILAATSARPDTPGRLRLKQRTARAAEHATFRGVSRASIAHGLHPAREHDAALIDRIRAMGERMGRDAFLRQLRLDRPPEHDLPQIACPTLIVAAAQDRLRSLDEAQEMQTAIPGATLSVIPDCGHMIPLEQPAAFAALVVGWLGDATAPAAPAHAPAHPAPHPSAAHADQRRSPDQDR